MTNENIRKLISIALETGTTGAEEIAHAALEELGYIEGHSKAIKSSYEPLQQGYSHQLGLLMTCNEKLASLKTATKQVLDFDWHDNDESACQAIDQLAAVYESTKK